MARKATDRQIAVELMRRTVSDYEKFNPRRVFYERRDGRWRYIGKAHDYSAFDESIALFRENNPNWVAKANSNG